MRRSKTRRNGVRCVLRALVVCSAVLVGVGAAAPSVAGAAELVQDESLDTIVLRSGRVVKGRILDESATEIRVEVIVAGISAPTTYKLKDVLRIERGVKAAEGEAGSGDGDEPAEEVIVRRRDRSGDGTGPKVYHMRLDGRFGLDIAPPPIREVLEDARKHEPDFLIVELDNLWGQLEGDLFAYADDEAAAFDEFQVADQIEPLFTKVIPQTWEKQPHVVFWVKNAMGGAAFLPFVADSIFFESQGRMGGIGNLAEMFEGVGDEVVRQKQRSLRLGRAQGMAIAGGYDYRIVTAMTMRPYELCYRYTGGKAELFERVAERPGEMTLTDNGKDGNVDSMRDRVTGDGNDVLTLKAENAEKLGISLGTANTMEDILDGLGVLRNHQFVDSRSNKILSNWTATWKREVREIPRDWVDLMNEPMQGTTAREVKQAISRRINGIKKIMGRFRKFEGVIPPQALGLPPEAAMNVMIEQLTVQLMLIP